MAKAQQFRIDPNMAGASLPTIRNPGASGLSSQGNMMAVYAMRRLMRQQARMGRQIPGRVSPPPAPLKLKRF